MGRKGHAKDWFRIMNEKKGQGESPLPKPNVTGGAPVSTHVVALVKIAKGTATPSQTIRPPSPEMTVIEDHSFIRKRKGGARVEKVDSPKMGKSSQESVTCPLLEGMWSSTFYLGHKIDFSMDEIEKCVVEAMSEQQMTDTTMELACCTAMATWHLAYASDRGVLRFKLKRVQTQLNETVASHSQYEKNRKILKSCWRKLVDNQDQKATIVSLRIAEKEAREDKDTLHAKVGEDKEIMEEMGMTIVEEHTRGFKKALRQVSHLLNISTEGAGFDVKKDVYHGNLVPLRDIPEAVLSEVGPIQVAEVGIEEENVAATTTTREVREEDPTVL
ncbi:hypothetical protein V8G54_032531 [Vigna mungo]|uniref:Uncharacterized protein n=1 Tax=Vigna mungo TaxID=3915 RepID=A0AAQ3MMB9_VIGMU